MEPHDSFIVLPVRNRRAITLGCLRHLQSIGVFDWATPVIVDDCSTDGTADAVSSEFPNAVVLRGDGNLWWAGGIRAGMEYAVRKNAEFIFWLNDDCRPERGCLEALQSVAAKEQQIATAHSETPLGYIYGPQRKTRSGMVPSPADRGVVKVVDATAGNCVCIPGEVIQKIGFPDTDNLPHGFADVDYTLRAGKAGVKTLAVGDARCTNEENVQQATRSWLLSDEPLGTFWKAIFSKKYALHWKTSACFYFRHWGVWGIVLWLRPYVKLSCISILRLTIPHKILHRLFAERSAAWKAETIEKAEKLKS